MTVHLGESYTAGYWSGECFRVTRARQEYPCACGRHTIGRGDLYMSIRPGRLESMYGERYVRRLSMDHARWKMRIVDGQGNLVTTIGGKTE